MSSKTFHPFLFHSNLSFLFRCCDFDLVRERIWLFHIFILQLFIYASPIVVTFPSLLFAKKILIFFKLIVRLTFSFLQWVLCNLNQKGNERNMLVKSKTYQALFSWCIVPKIVIVVQFHAFM